MPIQGVSSCRVYFNQAIAYHGLAGDVKGMKLEFLVELAYKGSHPPQVISLQMRNERHELRDLYLPRSGRNRDLP